jgi:hypothetical protein
MPGFAHSLFESRGGWTLAWISGVPALHVLKPLTTQAEDFPRIQFAGVYLLMKEGKIGEAHRVFDAICASGLDSSARSADINLFAERIILEYFLRFHEDHDPEPAEIAAEWILKAWESR